MFTTTVRALGALVLVTMLMVSSAAARPATLRRLSEAPDGSQANGESYEPSLSRDGSLVVFSSDASNLVAQESQEIDVYLFRAESDSLELVVRDRDGGPPNDGSRSAEISANGRYVAFASTASDLVEGDDNEAADVFVRDLETGTNEIVSVARDGELGNRYSGSPRISANGRFVAFDSRARNLSRFPDRNRKNDVFIHDRKKGTTNRVSVSSKGREADDNSYVVGVSDDGRRVAFVSFADNLVPDDTNEVGDAFVYDRDAKKLVRASVSSTEKEAFEGGFATDLSPDGRYVVFYSWDDDLVPGDTNESSDVFVRDLREGTTLRVSLADDESQANNYSHNEAQISADACLVTFDSGASNLVEGDTNGHNDVFVRDRCNGTTERLSVRPDGTEGNADSARPRISADGSHVAFATEATNLGGNDSNELEDVFLAKR